MAMSEPPKKRSSKPPRRASGEHPAVVAYRQKMESIEDTQLAELKQLNERLARKARDPRREDDDGSSIPIDVVELPDEPPKE